MVDIHCHILPAVDDGSRSWEMTAEMCRIAAADGIRHVVATPHCDDHYPYSREACEAMLEHLRECSEGRLTFSVGCDFHFSFDNLTDLNENRARYTIGGTQYLLIEFSDYALPPNLPEQVAALTSGGIVPIITHPERNPLLATRPEKVLELVEKGALVQLTANAITGFWGARAKSASEWLLERRAVHVIASDAHDVKFRRPVLSEARDAVAQTYGREMAQTLVSKNPLAIVEGRPLTQN